MLTVRAIQYDDQGNIIDSTIHDSVLNVTIVDVSEYPEYSDIESGIAAVINTLSGPATLDAKRWVIVPHLAAARRAEV